MVNIYTWFREESPVPQGENAGYWKRLDARMKDLDLDGLERAACLQKADPGEPVEKALPSIPFSEQMKREVLDLPLYLLVYGGFVLCLFEAVSTSSWTMAFGLGLFLQLVGLYAAFKLLLYGINHFPEGPGRWLTLIVFFILYMGLLYLAGQMDSVWFTLPVPVALVLFCAPWVLTRRIGK